MTGLPNGVLGGADGSLQAFLVPLGGSDAVRIGLGQDPVEARSRR